MAIAITCTCGKSFQAKVELAGKTVKCPSCGQPLAIPQLVDKQQSPEPEKQPVGVDDDPLATTDVPLGNTPYGNAYASANQPQLKPAGSMSESCKWAMMLHFSLLAGLLIPLAGLVVPIIIWQVKKDEFPGIDDHGKVVLNWMITLIIVSAAIGIVFSIIAGIIIRGMTFNSVEQVVNYRTPFWLITTLYALSTPVAIAAIVFPIIGGLKAKDGEVWPYPFSYDFVD